MLGTRSTSHVRFLYKANVPRLRAFERESLADREVLGQERNPPSTTGTSVTTMLETSSSERNRRTVTPPSTYTFNLRAQRGENVCTDVCAL